MGLSTLKRDHIKRNLKSEEYDVVIIGGGIGGLVCGALLANAGLKVFISEKNASPGGYCSSFHVKGYYFDSFVHSLGNISPGGQFYKILTQLNILENLNFIRHNPTDTIITPDKRISFWIDVNNTIKDFVKAFPREEKNIRRFFLDILSFKDMDSVRTFRNKTFKEILDINFENENLKSVLGLVILGNVGVPAKYVSAFTAIKHYKQFMLDGGYYPKNGISAIPDELSKRFLMLGGELSLSNKTVAIGVKDNVAKYVDLQDGKRIFAQYIVSGCDAKTTFLNLIGNQKVNPEIITKIGSLKPSLSLFIIYLGLKETAKRPLQEGVNTWYFDDYNYSAYLDSNLNYIDDDIKWCMVRPNYHKKNYMIFANAPYVSKEFWKNEKQFYFNKVLQYVQKKIPDILDCVEIKISANPSVLENWTSNSFGAAYGWAAFPTQFMESEFIRDNVIKNLFLCGHWSTIGQGVPGVSIVGEKIANIIMKRM